MIGLRRERRGWRVSGGASEDAGVAGVFDLVVGVDGACSRIRHLSGLARKDVGYPYGALGSVVPDPDRLATDVLFQRYDDTRITLGILPTGIGQASIFWSVRSRDIPAAVSAGTEAFVAAARPYGGTLALLVERARQTEVLGARYRDVVVRSPVLADRSRGLVLLGDAAHAMSPQLGLGADLGLADAWTLAACLRARPRDLELALDDHGRARRAHIRYYAWCSRSMTPVFQSDLVPLAWARDLLAEPVARIPWVRRQFVTTLMGTRTSPWTTWHLPPGPGGAGLRWIGVAMISALIGPVWAWLDPFATLYDLGAAAARRLGVTGWRAEPYPRGLGRWPAAAGFAVVVWLELVANATGGSFLAGLMIAYTIITLAAMAQFGRDRWLHRGELFGVWFLLLGRIAPLALEGPASGAGSASVASLPGS